MAELWNSVTAPTHTETQVALSGLGKNGILCAGLYGAFLVIQATLPSDAVTVDLFDDTIAPTHGIAVVALSNSVTASTHVETKVALSGLSKDGILCSGSYGVYDRQNGLLPTGEYGRHRSVTGHPPAEAAAGAVVTGEGNSAGSSTVSAAGLVAAAGNPAVSDGSSTVSAIGTVPPPAGNPIRVTQIATEILQLGSPSARVTQVAREVLQVGDPSARVTQVAREILAAVLFNNPATSSGQATVTAAGYVPADELRTTQGALEHVDFPLNDVYETQAVLEKIESLPPALPYLTQAALEHVWGAPPTETQQTQFCLEVLYPADGFAFNHGFTGLRNSYGGTPSRGNFGYTA